MKRPAELVDDVIDKYEPIANERVPIVMKKLEEIVESKKIEYYLTGKIYIGGRIKCPNLEGFKEEEQELIRYFVKRELQKEVGKVGWMILEDKLGQYLCKNG